MVFQRSPVNFPNLALTALIRILFWAPTIWILVLCIERGYSLLMLHVVFSTIGCVLLLAEATLVVTGDALLVAKVSRSNRVRIHWILHTVGLIALAFGFGLIESHKIRNNSNHFTSDHGKVGLTGYVVAFVVALAAIPTVWTRVLPKMVSLAKCKFIHIFAGIVSLIMLWASEITGLYTSWWQGSDVGTSLTILAYVVGGILLLGRPLYSTISRISRTSSYEI